LVQDEARKCETEIRVALPAVGVGVLAVSAGAIFIRLADAPAFAVAFWRNALACSFYCLSLFTGGKPFRRGGLYPMESLRGRRWGRISGSGSPRSTT
jgi:hypothetical protein